ncbi:hypothetical protein [Cohnella hongkongensis]|uniref:Uncharacterized protein n=1 Tax=Cohnella hongkongensis TaxID=178337 RepID=A0ABV9FG67_9BACL
MSSKKFDLSDLQMDSFYYIAHLLDRVLVGCKDDDQYSRLVSALELGEVIEAHFFNKEQEIYIALEEDQLIAYEPMKHSNEGFQRVYQIDSERWGYKRLFVREYVDFEDHLAYVRQTVLYDLEK